jgi:AraC family transcriptional activator FtrA
MVTSAPASGITAARTPRKISSNARSRIGSTMSFLREFRAVTATTTLQWLVHERVARARELLETTDDTIDRIAERCGFGTAASLRTHFVRINKIGPSPYRQTFRPRSVA